MSNKALFLDRDGVINVDKHHVYRIEDCEFVDGIFDICRQAKKDGYLIIVVTNQAGIAKGKYTEEDYFKFRDYVHNEFEKQGCKIDGEYFCPYHTEAVIEKYRQDSFDRKPNPGMILKAQKDFDIDLSQSILIGDKESDIEAGKRAGIKECKLINNNKKILISGRFGLFPTGRHALSFLGCLLNNKNYEIYINKDFLTEEGLSTIKLFFAKEIENKTIKFDTDLGKNTIYDFNIFPHPLPIENTAKELRLFNKKQSKIKICYPVFDGTVPLLEWIDIINKYFDICLSPSEYCTHNLIRHGVKIPCKNLECVVLLDEMLNIKFEPQNKKFRFGCISANESRKNLPFLIEAFSMAFSKDDNVELYIHAVDRYDIMCSEELLDKTYEKYATKANIILEKGFKSHNEMVDLWSTFNAYICPQSVTGYFTTPAEAMAVGIPCILSDIPVHRELTKYISEKDNLFFVPHNEMKTFFHGVFNYRNLGVKFDSTLELYSVALKKVYEQNENLLRESCINYRKNAIKILCFEQLSLKYKELFDNINSIDFQFQLGKYKELDPVHISIEETAINNQKIIIELRKNNIENKYIKKIKHKFEKYNTKLFIKLLYVILSLYCSLKALFTQKRNMKVNKNF